MTSIRPPNTGSTFRQRLGIYLLGVSLGLIMLGMLWSFRRMAAVSQQQQQTAPAVNPAPMPTNSGSSTAPASPGR